MVHIVAVVNKYGQLFTYQYSKMLVMICMLKVEAQNCTSFLFKFFLGLCFYSAHMGERC